jgi:hypothetical protein
MARRLTIAQQYCTAKAFDVCFLILCTFSIDNPQQVVYHVGNKLIHKTWNFLLSFFSFASLVRRSKTLRNRSDKENPSSIKRLG